MYALVAQGIDLLKDKQALQRLTEAAEKAKIELSGVQEVRQLGCTSRVLDPKPASLRVLRFCLAKLSGQDFPPVHHR